MLQKQNFGGFQYSFRL